MDVTIDQYPYTASSTGIAALVPHLRRIQQPVIAAINGAAVGMGATMTAPAVLVRNVMAFKVQYGISAIPTVIIFKNGQVAATKVDRRRHRRRRWHA